VHFYDLRFDSGLRVGGRRPLSAGVAVDRDGKVIREFMGVVAQPAPD
jgi:hypothetical protein